MSAVLFRLPSLKHRLASQCAHPARKRVVGDLEGGQPGQLRFTRRGARCPHRFRMDRRSADETGRRTNNATHCSASRTSVGQDLHPRAERLESEGRMQESGRALRPFNKPKRQKLRFHGKVDDLIEPEALMSALRAGKATTWWNSTYPSYRRNILMDCQSQAGFHQRKADIVVDLHPWRKGPQLLNLNHRSADLRRYHLDSKENPIKYPSNRHLIDGSNHEILMQGCCKGCIE